MVYVNHVIRELFFENLIFEIRRKELMDKTMKLIFVKFQQSSIAQKNLEFESEEDKNIHYLTSLRFVVRWTTEYC